MIPQNINLFTLLDFVQFYQTHNNYLPNFNQLIFSSFILYIVNNM